VVNNISHNISFTDITVCNEDSSDGKETTTDIILNLQNRLAEQQSRNDALSLDCKEYKRK